MLEIWNDPAFMRFVTDRGIRTLEQAEIALQNGVLKLYDDFGYGPFCMVLKKNLTPVGICGLFRRDNLQQPDIGFAVLPEYRGAGLAGEAASAVIEHTRDALGVAALNAIVAPDNRASVNLIEKLGFSFERHITMPDDDHHICLYRKRL